MQKLNAYFTCAAYVLGLQLFGDSQGKVWVYESSTLHSTVAVLTQPEGSAWQPNGTDGSNVVEEESSSKELVGLTAFGRGFAAVSAGGYVAICGLQRGRCEGSALSGLRPCRSSLDLVGAVHVHPRACSLNLHASGNLNTSHHKKVYTPTLALQCGIQVVRDGPADQSARV